MSAVVNGTPRWIGAKREYEAFKAWLPTSIGAMLDIGCGNVPRMTWWIARHYNGNGIEINLMDGDDKDDLRRRSQGYASKPTKPWSSRHKAVAWLRTQWPRCRIVGHPPDPSLTIPCDLIVSRQSWGHHYPVATYAELAMRSLRPGGRIIIDLRRGTGGLEELSARGFQRISEDILGGLKSERLVFARNEA